MNRVGFGQSSFTLNNLGLSAPGASSPKLQADFTTGTYKAGGATKTFADLFTFTRAGKAWLVKETGLQEYAADVPRLDDGLLIEQSATNYAAYSDLQVGGDFLTGGLVDVGGNWVRDNTYNNAYIYPRPHAIIDKSFICSLQPSVAATGFDMRLGDVYPPINSRSGKVYFSLYNHTVENSGATGVRFKEGLPEGVYLYYWQLEQFNSSNLPTSPIKTSTTPVTRPADFLLNKITGTTVTGDWDSTLNLSIVNGNLVHSGYGRIRSLEIN